MAEFKLSTIRYFWKGSWNNGTSYNRDDVVRYGGSSWVCIRQHTASTFLNDQTFLASPGDTVPSPAWIKMTDGYNFRETWQSGEIYNAGDIVILGGNLWLCVAIHTASGTFDPDLANWSLYISSDAFKQDWEENTRYEQGDVVKYNGVLYRCETAHLSADDLSGIEQDQEKWSIYYQGIEYKGNWAIDTRYRLNDLVRFGGAIFRCKDGHTSGSDSTINFDEEAYWELISPGFLYASEWSPTTVYPSGSIVKHGGWLYFSLSNNYGSNPAISVYQVEDQIEPADWQLIAKGINFRGEYDSNTLYKTGDVVRRGGNLYVALLDTELSADGSTLDYLDTSNWEIVVPGQAWRNVWQSDQTYILNDIVIYFGNTYICNLEHISDAQNFPGDNGSEVSYWDLLIPAGSEVGLISRGDLLTYNLSKTFVGDNSTFGPTRVPLGSSGQLLSINNEDSVFYKNYGEINRVFYVDLIGQDDSTEPLRGRSPFYPWRTVAFACSQSDDGFTGTTTIRVNAGKFNEVLPIVIPAKTVVLGSELRTTTISAASAGEMLSVNSQNLFTVLERISDIIESVISQNFTAKTPGNLEDPVVLSQISADAQVSTDIRQLIVDIEDYINFFVNSVGSNPVLVGSNTAVTDSGYTNAVLILEANKNFLAAEAVALIKLVYPTLIFNEELLKNDVRRFIDAWKYDIINTGNYKSILAARQYSNAVLGSESEDMFYCRDSTGVRNCTLNGLVGTLTPPSVVDLDKRPSGGAYISLDPGWGPADEKIWITNRSPYIQGVTTFGVGCVGQKIDGAIHNGGNKSIVSNDFTQVISDGIGAWVANNGRAELVSVFTYYAHMGYLAESGGVIRATNGNCSYGTFGAVSDGVDATEVLKTAVSYTRAQQAIVATAFAGDFVDEIQILEWTNAGQDYSSATATFIGAGAGASVVFEDFRDDAVFEARRLDASTGINTSIGGSGYVTVQNNAQTGDLTSITISANDPNAEANYLGMRIVLTSGPGTGQYGYITAYDTGTKVVQVSRESDDQPGWDHVVPGKTLANPLGTGTTYRIEPRVIFSPPEYLATNVTVPTNTTWTDIAYSDTTETYLNRTAGFGEGPFDEGFVPIEATFNVTKVGRSYTVTLVNPGAGYTFGQELVIPGTQLGGETPLNDLILLITGVTEDSTNAITSIEPRTFGTGEDNEAASGRFVAIASGGSAAIYSSDGINWSQTSMPSSGNWKAIAGGNNRFVAIRKGSNLAASSLDGINWTSRTMPGNRDWNAVAYGNGIFVAVSGNFDDGAFSNNGTSWTSTSLPDIGDSTVNEWVDITYGKQLFVALSNSGNYVATGTYDSVNNTLSWQGHVMDTINDSSNRSWQSIAYGNNRFVAISDTGDVAYSFDSIDWFPATMPTPDGSTIINWKKIRYAQGVFFAVGNIKFGVSTTYAATSFDGILWTDRELESNLSWESIGFGNPYVSQRDSSVGKRTPTWIAIPSGSNIFNKIQTGARALGRAIVSGGIVSEVRLWDTGSGYIESPTCTLVDPNNGSEVLIECRMGDSVLTNPSWLNRGIGYRSNTTRITITGNGFADVIPTGKFLVINDLDEYPGPGSQLLIQGLESLYTLVTVTPIGPTDRGLAALVRISPELKVRDNLQHLTPISIRSKFSQCRITGHDFLDIGTGNFEETNYPELYTGFYTPSPENEVVEENGGRVFYTSTDQNGNFRTGELFAVEQATGTVTISADFFDFSGLTELRLGGIRLGGTGAVVREFSTDPLFSEDSNNIVPTQRAIRAYLAGRLSVGGSEISVGSFIAGTVQVGPDRIGNVANIPNLIPVVANFGGPKAGISGNMLAQQMFYRSFKDR